MRIPFPRPFLFVAAALTAMSPAGGGAPIARPLAPPRAAVAPLLPDSVLLRIDGREDITRRRFARAVRLLGGDPDSLTPGSRDRFLELVLEQRVLAAHATRGRRPWDHADSAQFLSERDNILLRAAMSDEFTRIEARRRAAGQPELDEQAMGVAARESLMLTLAPRWDDALLRRVGGYFALLPRPAPTMTALEQIKLLKQLPNIPGEDTSAVLARSSLGDLTVADVVADWKHLASMYRPHIDDAQGVRQLGENSLFQRSLRMAAVNPALLAHPVVAAVISDRIEYHAVSQYLQHEVMEKIPSDSLTLSAWYRAHRADFDRPARAVMVLLALDDRGSADSLARLFTVPGEAESLAFHAQSGGANYTHVATLATDSARYERARRIGVGGVAGPDSVDGAWQVWKVLSLDSQAMQAFSAVRTPVKQAWYEFESERRVRALLDRLKAAARVQRNGAALRAIVLSPPPARR